MTLMNTRITKELDGFRLHVNSGERDEKEGNVHVYVRWRNAGRGERGISTWQSLSISGSLRPGKAVDI